MAELKTKPNAADVTIFLDGIQDVSKRKDAFTILELMKAVTKKKPVMWGPSIIGFGTYHFKYASGRAIGFSPDSRRVRTI